MPLDENFYKKKAERPISLGTSVFTELEGAYYVDKTLFVKDIIDSHIKVILFTRPRRFGKSLNMSMLQTFFEKPLDGEDTSHYFNNLKIWQAGEKYTSEQGKRPVISLSLKDMMSGKAESVIKAIMIILSDEFKRHIYLEKSSALSKDDKSIFSKIAANEADSESFSFALKHLIRMLHQHYSEKPILLIDEYDVPIQMAWGESEGDYRKVVAFMKALLTGALKDNKNLYKGVLTGVSRVSKESIFSGLNNVEANTVFSKDFSQYFGFTQEEVDEALSFYGIEDKKAEVRDWYDGYRFGNTEIYNPLSFMKYVKEDCTPMAYWANTSDNALMGEMLERLGSEDRQKLIDFVQGGAIEADVDMNIVFPQIMKDSGLIYSLLAQSGYLKSIDTKPRGKGYVCKLTIPNREIAYIYSEEIINRFMGEPDSQRRGRTLLNAIIGGETEEIQKALEEYFIRNCSYLDLTEEQDYHNFILGLLAAMSDGYSVTSNRESGKGRYDLIMRPHRNRRYLPGIIFEFKHCKPSKSKNPNIKRQQARLEREAQKALEQIETQKYIEEMRSEGITKIIRYGAAFCGKEAKVIRRSE